MAKKSRRQGAARNVERIEGNVEAQFTRGVSFSSTIRDLLAYRIHVVANAMSRSAAARYRREFDVTLGEWRTVALLAGYGPLGLNQLARQAGVDRGQISRIVAGLAARGLVSGMHEIKGRPVNLLLTAKGKRLFAGLFKAAIDRDEVFLGALTARERESFDRMLNKILTVARQVERNEKAKSAEGTSPSVSPIGRRKTGVDFTTPVR